MTTETASTEPAVAPFILEAVKDIALPRGIPRPVGTYDHLEGPKGFFDGVVNIGKFMRNGVNWARDLVDTMPPVFCVRFGPETNVCISDPDEILAAFKNESGAFSAAIAWKKSFDGIDDNDGRIRGPLFSDLHAHRDVRKLLAPAFSQAAMSGYLDVAYPMFEATVERWIARRVVDSKSDVRSLLAAVAGRIFVGFTEPSDQAALDRWMKDVWRAPLAIVRNPYLDPNWRAARRAYREVMAKLESLVRARRSEPTDDLLGRVASSTEAVASDLDDDFARASVVLNIMLGAFDTTASGLGSFVYLLARHPEWQEKLRAEALALGERPISFEETRQLELCDRAWKETLRLFPVTPAPPRVALRDLDVRGYHIPAGSTVALLLNAQMFNRSIWTEPDRFDPDRFSPERAEDKRHRGGYLPFGAGPHTCIGMQLANAEVKAFAHALLTRCRFRLERDYEGTHGYEPMGTVSGKVRLVVERL